VVVKLADGGVLGEFRALTLNAVSRHPYRSARAFQPALEELDRCLHGGWADPDRSVR
jgi:hypothetical protein